ncbi:hypothetical protein [Dokdonia sp.]|uniref:hypothetical protein n=1 Tax=Dokdonia sp. TaxID=2024995 RepID=UPI00326462C4
MKLTSKQEDTIKALVKKQGIQLPSLQDDIIDHLCCVVESQLGKEKEFDQLLQEAIIDIAPNGLKDIQHQTIFLLNSKRILIMKKLMYSIGFLGALSLTAGIAFKLFWYPGADILFTIGIITLFLVFIPLVALDRYKVAISKTLSERLKIVLGAIAAIIAGITVLFKIFHLQGADILLGATAIIFGFGFLPFLFFTMYKKSVS